MAPGSAWRSVVEFPERGFSNQISAYCGGQSGWCEERPVPASDVPGEKTAPTQPFPTKPPPFARQKFTVDDLSPYLSAGDRARFRSALARYVSRFAPQRQRGGLHDGGHRRNVAAPGDL